MRRHIEQEIKMNNAWVQQQVINHWKMDRPAMYEHLKDDGQLQAKAEEAAERIQKRILELIEAGANHQEAWESVREKYLFLPEEEEQKEEKERMPISDLHEIMLILTGQEDLSDEPETDESVLRSDDPERVAKARRELETLADELRRLLRENENSQDGSKSFEDPH